MLVSFSRNLGHILNKEQNSKWGCGMKKRVFFFNAIILTASSLVMRASSIGYRTYLSSKIGTAGMGLYQLVMSVFILAITVSTSGISLAVTRIVTDTIAKGAPSQAKRAVRKCIIFALLLSLLAMVALYFSSDYVAIHWLGDQRVALSLKILAPGLPLMATCSCLKGYFIAMRGVAKTASGELLEQFVTIMAVVCLFTFVEPQGLEYSCAAIMLGSTLGEIASCTYTFIFFIKDKIKAKDTPGNQFQYTFRKALQDMFHIELPIMFGSTLRNGLVTIENILIPIGFKKHGASTETSLSNYGMIHGMVMPLILFPSAFLMAFSSLLVPEMAEANAVGHKRTISRTTARSMQLTLLFSFFITACFIVFADDFGRTFYQSEEAGRLIRFLAPLIPLLYLDSVVDGILKGLDQQIASMRYNFADSGLRVILVYFLIPFTGVNGYLGILFFSTIFNATLSIHRLLKVSQVEIQFVDWIVKPILCGGISVLCFSLLRHLPFMNAVPVWCCMILEFTLSAIGYYILLRVTQCFKKEDVTCIKEIFHSKSAT